MSKGPHNVSGFGTKINIIASSTFPTGFIVSQFADDAVDVAGTAPATRAVVRVEASNGLTRLYRRDVRTQFRMERVKLNIIPLSVAVMRVNQRQQRRRLTLAEH